MNKQANNETNKHRVSDGRTRVGVWGDKISEGPRKTLRVKTKVRDGGTTKKAALDEAQHRRLPALDSPQDAFLRYSTNAVFRRHLVGLNEEAETAAARNEGRPDRHYARKTRLSTERHIGALSLLDDLL